MKKFLLLIGFLLIFGIAGQASAITVENPSFESGLTEWENSGASASTIDMGGAYDYVAQLVGQDAYIYQALNWSTGDTISFDWNFINVDSSDDESGFFGILDLSSNLVDSIESLFPINGNGTSSGWQTYSYTFTFDSTSDDYAIIFGVDSVIPYWVPSAAPIFLVDNITTTTVPEPASLFLLGSGLLSIAAISRKF